MHALSPHTHTVAKSTALEHSAVHSVPQQWCNALELAQVHAASASLIVNRGDPKVAISLRAPYAVSGTHVAYGVSGTGMLYAAMRCPALIVSGATPLVWCYAIHSTVLRYDPTA
eukprot:1748033-Rhodomonas_salina.1